MRTHFLDSSQFADLAAGHGTASAIASLRAGQVSRRLLCLRAIRDRAGHAGLDRAAALLDEVRSRYRDAFTGVVALPAFGTWSALTLGALVARDPAADVLLDQFGVFAVTAAVRAGTGCSLDLRAVDGAVFLPGLGRAAVADEWVTVDGKDGSYRIGETRLPGDPTHDGPQWTALRRIGATHEGLRVEVVLDDLDPWRDNHGLSAAGRQPADEVDRWQGLLDEAWRILVTHHRPYAEGIAAGLSTVVPLNPPASGNTINATSMWAFGSVSLTRPSTGLGLASSLLHEFQHAKLGALLDMYPFYDDNGARRHYAPWRDDPRPLSGVLQGIYAFHGVTDFWRVERRVLDGADARFAEFEFARWREQVARALDRLERCDSFNSSGRRFLHGLREAQRPWFDESVAADALALAGQAAEDHWTDWRLRNFHVDADDLSALAAAWTSGTAPAGPVRSRLVARDVRERARNPRLDLAILRLNDPDEFAGACADVTPTAGFSFADTRYARGDFAGAVAAYREQIAADPDDRTSWVGLAMAARRLADGPSVWLRRPELPFAVHRAVREAGDPPPDPARLGLWLDQVGGGSTTQ